MVLNLISTHSGRGKSLPPMIDYSLDPYGFDFWLESDIHNTLDGMLNYISFFKVASTANWKPVVTGNNLHDILYNIGYTIPNNVSFSSKRLSIYFDYVAFWDTYFDLNCDGEICRPSGVGNSVMPINFGMQEYKFAYDYSFPVKVEIKDPRAFNNQGFSFNFMLEANIRNNEPMNANVISLTSSTPPTGDSMFGNMNQRVVGPFTFKVINGITGEVVEKVNVEHYCAASYLVGITDETGLLKANLTPCLGGQIVLKKEGFKNSRHNMLVSSDSFNSDIIEIEIYPYQELKLEIKKKNLIREGVESWRFYDNSERIHETLEEVSVLITAVDSDQLIQVISYIPGNNEEYSVTLAPDQDYKIDLYLLANYSIIVDPETRTFDTGLFSETSVDIGGVNMSSPPSNLLGKTSYTIKFDDVDLEGKEKITLFVVAADFYSVDQKSLKVEDINILGDFDKVSLNNLISLMPIIDGNRASLADEYVNLLTGESS
jgi:hypothetical protein